MSIIRRWQRSCYKRMLKARLVTPKVVVLMDGGICSQMLQYLLGEFFRKRGCNGEVTWIINLPAILIC